MLIFLAFAAPAFAQAEKPPLVWGMDSSGGAPYIFDNNTKGFEVELAAYLAKELGRIGEPADSDWDKLPEQLDKGEVDLVLNGYEYSEKYRGMASVPYYIYNLTLVVNAANTDVYTWADLKKREKMRVGVLEGSAAQFYLEATYGDTIAIEVYRDVASTYQLVAEGRIDATVQDNSAATFYASNDRNLRQIEETKGQGAYVILTRKEDSELRGQIDAALRKAIDDGTLEKIYRKYSIWNDDQERLGYWKNKSWGDRERTPVQQKLNAPTMDWDAARKLLLMAAGMTVFLAVCSMPLATLVGILVAMLRLYGPRVLKPFLSAYVELLRGTPLLLQLYVLFYMLPKLFPFLGNTSPILFGIFSLALNYSASQAEHFRGAFLNLPRGQYEAALSLGLPRWKAIRYILAPQAARAAVPSVTNDFVALFKDTAVCSVIAVMELTKQYNTLYNNHRDQMFALAAVTAGLYLAMSYPLALVSRRLEHKAAGR